MRSGSSTRIQHSPCRPAALDCRARGHGASLVRALVSGALFLAVLVAGAPAAPVFAAPAMPPPQTGEVTYYAPPRDGSPSLMVLVWNWRIYYGHVPECPECVDAIALLEPGLIGKKVWLRHPDGETIGPLMVVDCAEAKHRPNLRKRGWGADISWELGQRWKMSGPLKGVTVLFAAPDHVDVTTAITRPTSCPMDVCTAR